MSLDNVLPMSLDNSVTYVPGRFKLAGWGMGRDQLPALRDERGDVLAVRGALDRQANNSVGSREIGAEEQSSGNSARPHQGSQGGRARAPTCLRMSACPRKCSGT
jgi:hypothetical protein